MVNKRVQSWWDNGGKILALKYICDSDEILVYGNNVAATYRIMISSPKGQSVVAYCGETGEAFIDKSGKLISRGLFDRFREHCYHFIRYPRHFLGLEPYELGAYKIIFEVDRTCSDKENRKEREKQLILSQKDKPYLQCSHFPKFPGKRIDLCIRNQYRRSALKEAFGDDWIEIPRTLNNEVYKT